MLKRYHHSVGLVFRGSDALVVGLSWLAAYWLRFYTPFIEITRGLPAFETYAALLPIVVAIWSAVFTYNRVYAGDRILRRTDEVYLILRSHGIAMLTFLALTYFFSEYKYSRAVMVFFGALSAFLLIFTRLLLRNTVRTLRKRGHHLHQVICIGEGPSLETLIQRWKKFPELGIRVAAVLPLKDPQLENLKSLIEQYKIDQIVIALPHQQYSSLESVLAKIKNETIDIHLIPDLHEYMAIGCAIEEFEGIPIVHLNDSPLHGWSALLKRLGDVVLSGFALVFLSPIFLLIGFLVRVTSPGPIFYGQERMGMDGRIFKMLKFRSMRADAEAKTGAVWAKESDDRRTRLGEILRSTSLDELPQFWNVFVGHMSLVGPRPERPVFVEKFRNDIPHYMLRHKVKAGITGWAQVNGWRGNTSLDRRIECDLYYIRNWSLSLDLKILLMTIWKGFINKNAY